MARGDQRHLTQSWKAKQPVRAWRLTFGRAVAWLIEEFLQLSHILGENPARHPTRRYKLEASDRILAKMRGGGLGRFGPVAGPAVAKAVAELVAVGAVSVIRGNLDYVEDDGAHVRVVPEVIRGNSGKDNVK